MQINDTAEVLTHLFVDIDLIISSPLVRAYEGAEIIAERMSYEKSVNILVVAHGAILYAILTAITDGQIVYGGKMNRLDQASLHLIKYIDGAIQLAEYDKDSSMFTGIVFHAN